MKKYFLTFLMVFAAVAAKAQLTPNAENWYEIFTPAQLAEFAQIVNKSGNYADSSAKTSANAKLMTDIDMTGISFEGIGNTPSYRGTFDGNGHTIIFDGWTPPKDYGGFINHCEKCTVQNVTVAGSLTNNGYGKSLGAIVGTLSNGRIINCYNTATLTATYIGGIAATVQGGSITRCGNFGKVQADGSNGAAGITAFLSGTVEISYCFNAGEISGSGTAAAICAQAGTNGSPDVNQNIHHCYNIGEADIFTAYHRDVTGNSSDVQNNFDGRGLTYNGQAVESFTEAERKSGALAWRLNGGVETTDAVWRQNLSGTVDTLPLPASAHGIVYAQKYSGTQTPTGVYANAPLADLEPCANAANHHANGTDMTQVEGVAPTCVEPGRAGYWECNHCHGKFADDGTEVTPDQLTIAATGVHTFGEDGVCTACHEAYQACPTETRGETVWYQINNLGNYLWLCGKTKTEPDVEYNVDLNTNLDLTPLAASGTDPENFLMATAYNGGYHGQFNGNYHTVKVKIDRTNINGTGLFARIKSATVWHLNLEGEVSAPCLAGSIAGVVEKTLILSGCSSKMTVKLTSTGNENLLGAGLVAGLEQNAEVGMLDCSFTGRFEGVDGKHYQWGGLVGGSRDDASDITVTVQNSFAAFTVKNIAETDVRPIVYALDNTNITVDDCYYQAASAHPSALGAEFKTEAQFRSGEVCWLLNDSGRTEVPVWYQTLGADGDSVPVMDTTHSVVYFGYADCETTVPFSNTEGGYETPGHVLIRHEAVAATCTTAGTELYWECSRCHKLFSDSVNLTEISEPIVVPAGHVLVRHEAVAATCTTAGTELYWECSRCHKLFSDSANLTEISEPVVVPALGHDLVRHEAVAATCTTAGTELYWECSRCHKLFSDSINLTEISEPVVIPALGHALVRHEAVAATCTTAGTELYWECSRCHKLFSDSANLTEISEPVVIPALGHALVRHEAVAATCTTAGTELYWECSRCHKLFSDSVNLTEISEPVVIPALGHSYGEPVWTWTDDFKASVTFTCTRDQHTETPEVTVTSAVTVEPTYEAEGEKTYTATCTFNDSTYTDTKKEILPKLEPTVGVEDIAEVAFTVYPNPCAGRFTVEVAEDATMEIYNAAGVLVVKDVLAAGKRAVSLHGSGIYFVKMTAGGRASVKRVIVR